ncbi:MAG: flagellar motor switch protein FliM [Planctomycetaceae bacterium]
MAVVLSQSEVESLLAALIPETQSERQAGGAGGPRRDAAVGQASIYDFQRPERVNNDQLRALGALHEGFGREFATTLGGMLRSIVEVKLIRADRLTYREFVSGVDVPTCFNVLYSKGLNGHLILDVNPSIIFPMVDRLLGGGKAHKQAVPARPLTDIEFKLVSRITNLAMRGFEKAWRNVCDLQLEVTQVESNPQRAQIVALDEDVVVIRFEITLGESRGLMNLCIPLATIESLAGKLSPDTWSAYANRLPDPQQMRNLETSPQQAGVNMVVQLGETRLSATEVMNLAVGDIIMTEHATSQGLQVLIEGRVLFDGLAGVFKGHKAIRIRQTMAPPEGLVEETC